MVLMADTISTGEEKMLAWFKENREGRYTSYNTICKYFCCIKNMKQVVHNLVEKGKLKKLKSGYKLVDKEIK